MTAMTRVFHALGFGCGFVLAALLWTIRPLRRPLVRWVARRDPEIARLYRDWAD